MRAYSNGGYQNTNQVGEFPGMLNVWYNRDSMLNILSFRDVRENFRITMDTNKENSIRVHLLGGSTKFMEAESGLYLLRNNKDTKDKISAYSF